MKVSGKHIVLSALRTPHSALRTPHSARSRSPLPRRRRGDESPLFSAGTVHSLAFSQRLLTSSPTPDSVDGRPADCDGRFAHCDCRQGVCGAGEGVGDGRKYICDGWQATGDASSSVCARNQSICGCHRCLSCSLRRLVHRPNRLISRFRCHSSRPNRHISRPNRLLSHLRHQFFRLRYDFNRFIRLHHLRSFHFSHPARLLPHPDPLPLGEGTSTGDFLRSSPTVPAPAAAPRSPARPDTLLLPAGEGRDEGENSRPPTASSFPQTPDPRP